jgi:hypothetical protein
MLVLAGSSEPRDEDAIDPMQQPSDHGHLGAGGMGEEEAVGEAQSAAGEPTIVPEGGAPPVLHRDLRDRAVEGHKRA